MLTAICFKHQIAHIAANHDRLAQRNLIRELSKRAAAARQNIDPKVRSKIARRAALNRWQTARRRDHAAARARLKMIPSPVATPREIISSHHRPGKRSGPDGGYRLVNSLSPATRSCFSFALLMRYSNSRPLCGSCLITSYAPPRTLRLTGRSSRFHRLGICARASGNPPCSAVQRLHLDATLRRTQGGSFNLSLKFP
jgi:hypothetical protein